MSKLRKIMIVVEETGERDSNGDQTWICYLSGDKERLTAEKLPAVDELSAAEFWGSKLFLLCQDVIKRTGAYRYEVDMSKATKGH